MGEKLTGEKIRTKKTRQAVTAQFIYDMQDPNASSEAQCRATIDYQNAFNFIVGNLIQKTAIQNRQLAEDIAQESLWKAYEQIHMLKDRSVFPFWLMRIAMNLATTTLRRKEEQYKVVVSFQDPADQGAEDRESVSFGQTLADPKAEQAFHEVEMSDQYAQMGLLILCLSDLQACAVTSRYFGYSDKELIDHMGKNQNAFQRMRHAGFSKLRSLIDPRSFDYYGSPADHGVTFPQQVI